MKDYGSLFGWLIVIGLVITLLNYIVKFAYRKWISRLDKEFTFRKAYIKIQRLIVSYHRFFALFTTIMLIMHLAIQVQYRWVSKTGLIAAALMVANVFLGVYGHYYKKRKKSAWLYMHRAIAVLAALAIILHIALNAR